VGVGHVAREPDERVEHRGALGQPEGGALRDVGELEEPELRAQPAVVARASLLEALEVLIEVLLGEERRAVDAGELLAVGVAAPVRARDGLQLERLDALGRGRVRPAAQVGERPVRVQRDGRRAGVRDQVLDQLDLVRLVLGPEAREGLGHRDVLVHERLVGLDVLAHLLLEAIELGVGERDVLGELEVVVEAVLDRRADRDLHAGIELERRGGQDVGRVVADEPEGRLAVAALALGRDDANAVAVVQRRREVLHVVGVVDAHRERHARQARADRRGDVGAGGAVLELERVPVGERDLHRAGD
jgi:hypothetical protein